MGFCGRKGPPVCPLGRESTPLALRTDLQLSLQKTALFSPVWLAEPTFAMLERYVFLLILLTNTVTSVKNNTRDHY